MNCNDETQDIEVFPILMRLKMKRYATTRIPNFLKLYAHGYVLFTSISTGKVKLEPYVLSEGL